MLDAAEQLVLTPQDVTASLWPRAAAVLARQALEGSIRSFWRSRSMDLEACSWRAQLLCLREFAPEELARVAAQTYDNLSNACHFRPYELPPNKAELRDWIQAVRKVSRELVGEGLYNRTR